MSRTKVKNIFGIFAPIPIYTKNTTCKISCIYCPKEKNMPKSYTSNEATLRALKYDFCPKKQIQYYLKEIDKIDTSDKPKKLELIILGGTFSELDIKYRKDFFKKIYDTLNGNTSINLKEAKQNNKFAKYRASIINIETRPELISPNECDFLLSLGVSKIEIGVQSIYNNVLSIIKRPYTKLDVQNTTALMREYGFKIGYHIMLNLPNSTPDSDFAMLKEICTDNTFLPDGIKIYPLTLLKNKTLQPDMWDLYENGRWKPYSNKETTNILIEFLNIVPNYIKIQRIQRQFDKDNFIYNGIYFRQIINTKLKSNNTLNCLRSYEMQTYKQNICITNFNNIKIDYLKYGKNNFFIYATLQENNQTYLLGYLKLYLGKKCIIRELKVLGKSSKVGEKSLLQGKGLGKKLLNLSEQLAKEKNYEEIYAIASPGIRNYYEKEDYIETIHYMKKSLNKIQQNIGTQ